MCLWTFSIWRASAVGHGRVNGLRALPLRQPVRLPSSPLPIQQRACQTAWSGGASCSRAGWSPLPAPCPASLLEQPAVLPTLSCQSVDSPYARSALARTALFDRPACLPQQRQLKTNLARTSGASRLARRSGGNLDDLDSKVRSNCISAQSSGLRQEIPSRESRGPLNPTRVKAESYSQCR